MTKSAAVHFSVEFFFNAFGLVFDSQTSLTRVRYLQVLSIDFKIVSELAVSKQGLTALQLCHDLIPDRAAERFIVLFGWLKSSVACTRER